MADTTLVLVNLCCGISIDFTAIAGPIVAVIKTIRNMGGSIVWIVPPEQRIHSIFEDIKSPSDIISTTPDVEWVKKAQIIYVAGTMTHTSITETMRTINKIKHNDAAGCVIADASTSPKLHLHSDAIRSLDEITYVSTISHVLEPLAPGSPVTIQLPWVGAGDCSITYNAFAPSYDILAKEVQWRKMYQHGGEVPRLVTQQGTITTDETGTWEPLYRHPVDEISPVSAWTTTVSKIRESIERLSGMEVNHALIQHYRDGSDWIGQHSDKTLDILHNTPILNMSFGSTREFIITPKRCIEGIMSKTALPNCSVFSMGYETNRMYLHEIRRDMRSTREHNHIEASLGSSRISLTFRVVATFKRQSDSVLCGQGALCLPRSPKTQIAELLEAFSHDNAEAKEFSWNMWYRNGFDILTLVLEKSKS